MPLIVPPTGLAGLLWPEGEAASARAATKAGSVYCLSHGSICTLEELAETGVEPRWFQTYIYTDRGLTHEMAERAAAAGYEALIVTIDTQILGNRERDIRNGFVIPPRFSAGEIANMAFKLGWLFRMRRTIPKITFGNYRRPGDTNDLTTLHERMLTLPDQGMQWDDIAALRAVWKGPLLLKGILQPADAAEAVANGVDGVFVSNHGGRQLDGVASAFDALPRVADAVAGRAAVLLDGGIRRGTHIVKALALGADCCTIGRAQFWGLTVAGEAGVAHVFDIFRRELDLTMGLCGLADIASIGPDVLARPGKAARELTAAAAAALSGNGADDTLSMTAPKSVSTPLPRRAARRDRNPPATAIGSARDAPSTSDCTGAATRHLMGYVGRTSLQGSARKARTSASAPLVDAPTAERHREQRVEITIGGEREPGFLQRLPCRRAGAREQHAHAVHLRAGGAQRLREGEDTAGGGDQVLDQMDALTGDAASLDTPCGSVRLGLGPDVDHGESQPVRDEGGEGNACGDATGDDRGAGLRHGVRQRRRCPGASLGPRQDQPTVHVERRIEPRGQTERRLGAYQKGAGIE